MSQLPEAEGAGRALLPLVDVVLPVYNEEHDLPRSVQTLLDFLAQRLPLPSPGPLPSTARYWNIKLGTLSLTSLLL